MNDELERTYKEAVVAYFSWNFPRVTGENTRSLTKDSLSP
jgi:hypothetical protein